METFKVHLEMHTWLAWIHYQQSRMWSLFGPQNNRILSVCIYRTQFCSADLFTQTWEPVPLGRVCSQKLREAALHAAAAKCFHLKASSPAAALRQILPKGGDYLGPLHPTVSSPSHAQGWNLLVIHLTGFFNWFDFCFLVAALSLKSCALYQYL